MDNRDCNKCVYSTREGGCRKWTCEGTKTVEDIKTEARQSAIDECIEEVYRIAKSTTNVNKYLVYEYVVKNLERLKEQKNGK